MIFPDQDHLDTLPLLADRVRELRAGFYLTVLNLLSFSVWKKLEDNFQSLPRKAVSVGELFGTWP